MVIYRKYWNGYWIVQIIRWTGKYSSYKRKITQSFVFLFHSLLSFWLNFTHYSFGSIYKMVLRKWKNLSCSMVLPRKLFFWLIRPAPRNLITYRSSWITKVYLQPAHGPNDSNNWLNGVTVDHCFVLFTFLFWITSFMDYSNETKGKREHLLPLIEGYT